MEFIKLLLLSTIASIIPGQIIRFNFGQEGALTITDILTVTTGILFILHTLLIKKSIKIPPKIFFPAVLFIATAAASLYLSLNSFKIKEIVASSLFLVRFFFYFFITIVVYNTVKKQQITSWINSFLLIGLIFTVIGFAQFIIFPDLSSLMAYGWDPHQKRIVASLLDPNFSGFIFAALAAFSTSLYLYKKNKIYLFQSILFYAALILTFSRSAYLAAIAMILTIGILKSPKLALSAALVFLISASALPQMRSRITGALTLDETAQARFISWQNALTIFTANPIFGIGFNTYRYAQREYGFFPPGELGGHSGSGTDSSILLVMTTTGLVGVGLFIFLLGAIANSFAKGAKSNYLLLASLTFLIGLLIHSQFVNSFFFPQIALILWFILGINLTLDDL